MWGSTADCVLDCANLVPVDMSHHSTARQRMFKTQPKLHCITGQRLLEILRLDNNSLAKMTKAARDRERIVSSISWRLGYPVPASHVSHLDTEG